MRFQLNSIRFQFEYDLADLLLCDKMKEIENGGENLKNKGVEK